MSFDSSLLSFLFFFSASGEVWVFIFVFTVLTLPSFYNIFHFLWWINDVLFPEFVYVCVRICAFVCVCVRACVIRLQKHKLLRRPVWWVTGDSSVHTDKRLFCFSSVETLCPNSILNTNHTVNTIFWCPSVTPWGLRPLQKKLVNSGGYVARQVTKVHLFTLRSRNSVM